MTVYHPVAYLMLNYVVQCLKCLTEAERHLQHLPVEGSKAAESRLQMQLAKHLVVVSIVKVVIVGETMVKVARIVNIASIPERKSVLCRLVANSKECKDLAERFEVPEIVKFASNITVSRESNGVGLHVEGEFAVEIGSGSDLLPTTEIASTFETNLLLNLDGSMSFEEATDYDDEVDTSGDIDLGEIAAQYFGIEMYS